MPDRLPTFKPPWIAKRKRLRYADTNRPNAYRRGYCSRGWAAARREVLLRDNYQCRSCGAVVSGRAAHVDHIVRRSLTNSDDVDGLQTLCASCHSRKTCAETRGSHKRRRTSPAAKTPVGSSKTNVLEALARTPEIPEDF